MSWNPASERLFCLPAQQAIGRPLEILDWAESSTDQISAVARRVFASGEPELSEVTCRGGQRGMLPVTLRVLPVCDADGAVLGLSMVAREDSAHQRMDERLHDARRQRDEFLAIVSHELRTPLTSMLGYTDMLLRGLAGPLVPATNTYASHVRSAGDRLLEVVDGLLDYARLEAGGERLQLRPVNLRRVVRQVVQPFQKQALGKDIDLRLAIDRGVKARVQADDDKLRRILRSMVANALKFTPEQGWVAVQLGLDPDSSESVRVSVADSGIGIPQEVLPRVWEHFYQGDASLTRAYGGLGLGLSIARDLVTLHGGRVGASSRGPGAGSTFWFSLPLVRTS